MGEKHYLVRWEMDFFCETPEEAAKLALETQRNANSHATVFSVENVHTGVITEIDLEEETYLENCE